MILKRILIAEITTAHGIKGFVKVRSYADDPESLETYTLYTDETGDRTVCLSLKNPIKNDWIAEVKDVTDRNAAELLRGTKLYVDRAALPALPDGQFYHVDLMGLPAMDESENDLGIVTAIQNFGAGELVEIQTLSGETVYHALAGARIENGKITLPVLDTEEN